MMRIHNYLAFVIMLWANHAAADVVVRSGEHANFSRLVIYVDQKNAPTLQKTDTGYRFSSGDDSEEFDLSSVFDKIPKNRINAISSPAGGLIDISVDCECHAKTEQLSGGRFVIDIVSGAKKDKALVQIPPPEPTKTTHPTLSAQSARRGLPIFISSVAVDGEEKADEPKAETSQSATPKTIANQLINQEALRNQLSRAATQGLFTFDTATTETPEPEANAPFTPPLGPTQNIRHQLTIQTSVDRDISRLSTKITPPKNGQPCSPPDAFSVGSWGGDAKSTLQFPTYPVPVEGSLSKTDFKDANSLKAFVKQQLHLTLGAEALAVLRDQTIDFKDKPDLILIAEVMEIGQASNYAQMAAFLTCEGPTALWAALAQPRLPRDTDINKVAIISEFSALPKHLRIHLGPMLIRKFLSIGDTHSATTINQIVARGGAPTDSSNTLATAKLSLAEADFTSAEKQLNLVADADDQNSVEATVALIDQHIEKNEGIPAQAHERLDRLLLQHKASAEAALIRHTAIRALAHAAHFSEALEHLTLIEDFPNSEDIDHQRLLDELGSSLVQRASDGVFLRYTLSQQKYWRAATEKTRSKVAQRLLDLGFADEAATMLNSKAHPPGRAARTVMAKAALEQGQTDQALSYISGLESPEAKELRAIALGQQGDQSAAPSEDPELTSSSATEIPVSLKLEDLQGILRRAQTARATLERSLAEAPRP